MQSERLVLERLQQTYPRIRPAEDGWVLETTPDVLTPVPDPGDVLAYIAHRSRYDKKQLRDIEFALQKLVPIPPDTATIYHLEQVLASAG